MAEPGNDTTALIRQVLANQEKAIELQREQLELARAELERSSRTIQESVELQRAAVAKQSQVIKIVFPLIGVLLALLVYLMLRWDIL